MKLKAKQKVILTMILASSVAMTGCSQPSNDSNTTTTTNTNTVLSAISPTGTIQGNLIDAVTQQPIVGAVIDIGVATATTNQDGQFVIANVPATNIGTGAAAGVTLTGTYQVSINLKGVTSPVNMADATILKRYPDFSFTTAKVNYTSDVTHPLTGVATGVPFTVGKQSANITGIATDKFGTPVAAGLNVTLYSAVNAQNSATGNVGNPIPVPGSVLGTTTTDASGKFTFANIQAGVPIVITAQDTAGTLFGSSANAPHAIVNAPAENATVTLSFQAGNEVLVASTDVTPPTVVSVTPANFSDITPAATNVVFTFSEPIKQTSAVADVSPSNPNGLYSKVNVNFTGPKPLASNLTHTLAWSADRKTLTVTLPAVGASSMYTVDITPAVTAVMLTDDASNPVAVTDPKLVDSFTTNGGATAAAPTIALVNRASINATSTNGAPMAATLNWLPTSGAKGYNVYRTMNEVWGATTIAHPTVKINPTVLFVTNATDPFTDATLTPPNLDYVEYGNVKQTYGYVVKAVNSDGTESAASNAVTAADVVAPSLAAVPNGLLATTAVVCGAAATCDPTTGKITAITIPFDEQMDQVSASTPANYTSAQLGTFSSAAYTPATITAGPPLSISAANAAKVKLTLTTPVQPLPVNAVPFGYVKTGADGILQTLQGVGDVLNPLLITDVNGNTYIPIPNTACVTSSANGVAMAGGTVAVPDDVLVPGTLTSKAVITSGLNGICQTTAAGGDVQTLAVGTGTPTPNTVAITPGPTGILSATVVANRACVTAAANGATAMAEVLVGDDRLVLGTATTPSVITTGADGICQTTATGTDVQTLPVGTGSTTFLFLGGDDVLYPATTVVTVSGVNDVAGNAIAGKTKYNADGTVQ